ncbi:beta subunit of N-acylethanolamine-hydrolyzing acid amidase-domain-containing protein, partial [Penicillium alfredii]
MRSLVGMFDELIQPISCYIPETEEICGISRITGIHLYLLVCLNVVLDLLMGCTSGGVRVKDADNTKMMHFRTLDWGMDPLRDLIVQLDFVGDSNPDKVIASSITYVGFVGMLTGVRQDLSASLNFRPVHDSSRNVAFYFNHVLHHPGSQTLTLDQIVANIPSIPTTVAYLIFSDGSSAVTMEKDHRRAVVRSSKSFIVVTNHDQQLTSTPTEIVVEENNARWSCMQAKWDHKIRENVQARFDAEKEIEFAQRDHPVPPQGTRSSLRLRQKQRQSQEEERDKTRAESQASLLASSKHLRLAITKKEAIRWLKTYPTANEFTHYAALLDSAAGNIFWVERYDPALDETDLENE